MKKITTETKPEISITEKANLFSAWANLQIARLQLSEAHSKNRALGNGRQYDKEIIQIENFLAWIQNRLNEN